MANDAARQNSLTIAERFYNWLRSWIPSSGQFPQDDPVQTVSREVARVMYGIDVDEWQRGSGGRRLAWYDNFDKIFEKYGIERYDEMMQDAEVRANINAKRFAVISSDWRVVPASDNERDIRIADFITYTLQKCRGTITGVCFELLKAIYHGYSISEMCFDVIRGGDWNGYFGLTQIRSKNVLDYEFRFDPFGNIAELWLGYRSPQIMPLPLWKFLIYTYQSEYDLSLIHI